MPFVITLEIPVRMGPGAALGFELIGLTVRSDPERDTGQPVDSPNHFVSIAPTNRKNIYTKIVWGRLLTKSARPRGISATLETE